MKSRTNKTQKGDLVRVHQLEELCVLLNLTPVFAEVLYKGKILWLDPSMIIIDD